MSSAFFPQSRDYFLTSGPVKLSSAPTPPIKTILPVQISQLSNSLLNVFWAHHGVEQCGQPKQQQIHVFLGEADCQDAENTELFVLLYCFPFCQ